VGCTGIHPLQVDLAAEGEAVVCVGLCQAADIFVGLGSLEVVVVVVVVVVGVEPVRMKPRFDGTHSTCAVCQGRLSVVQYTGDSCSVVVVHIAVPQSAARVVDNLDLDARQTCPTSETHHC
jgi:hypothetical protein